MDIRDAYVGQVIVLHKPEERICYGLKWIEQMDELDGKEAVIEGIRDNNIILTNLRRGNDEFGYQWKFRPQWVEPVVYSSDETLVSCGDLEDLL